MAKVESTGSTTGKAPTRTKIVWGEMRYPRVISWEEIQSMPRVKFSEGCRSAVVVSRERDDAKYFYQGMCFHEPDMEDFVWEQASWDESYFCVSGVIRFIVKDRDGREETFDVKERECAYLPGGYWYTLRASGVAALNFWTMGPALRAGMAPLGEIDVEEAPEYAERLRQLRGKSLV